MNSMDNQAYGMSAGPQGSQADLHSRLRAAGALAEELCGYAGQNLSAGDAGVLRAALTALFLAGGDTGMFLPLGGESTAEFLGRYIREAEDAHDRMTRRC